MEFGQHMKLTKKHREPGISHAEQLFNWVKDPSLKRSEGIKTSHKQSALPSRFLGPVIYGVA